MVIGSDHRQQKYHAAA